MNGFALFFCCYGCLLVDCCCCYTVARFAVAWIAVVVSSQQTTVTSPQLADGVRSKLAVAMMDHVSSSIQDPLHQVSSLHRASISQQGKPFESVLLRM